MSIGERLWRPIDLIGCYLVGRKFIGGLSVEEVLARGAAFRRRGYLVTYNLLGEHVEDPSVVDCAMDTTWTLISSMDESNRGNISIKPTLYGLQISRDLFRRNAENLVQSASRVGVEVEFDAEQYEWIPATFEVFSGLASQPSLKKFVRQAVQAHLKDIRPLMDTYGLWDKQIRIVKGAGVYQEADGIVFKDPARIIEQYLMILQRNMLTGQVPYVATVRDRNLAMHVMKMFPDSNTVAFEMLYGLFGRGLGNDLFHAGYPVRIYIPFVADWCKDAWKIYGLRRAEMMRQLIWEEIKSKFRKQKTAFIA